jgi:geranylgeranyl diphosphate synthase type I
MNNNNTPYRGLYKSFTDHYAPLVDSFINEFYIEKIKSAESDYMRELYDVIREYCLREGKRIRPMLLINSYLGYRKGFKKVNEIIGFGAAVELMHSFLLIQDDIIDKSESRRGGEAMHILLRKKYAQVTGINTIGADAAIVLADVIFANVIEIISRANIKGDEKNRFLSIFAGTYEKTAWGQILDSLSSMPRKADIQGDTPLRISLMKTAFYTMAYPMIMGYVLSGEKKKNEMQSIEKFSLPLGIAFQIRDDILGVFGVEKETGKSVDSDIYEGKFTLLVQNTLQRLPENDQEEFLKILLDSEKKSSHVAYIRGKIIDSGSIDDTLERHSQLINEAVEELEKLRINEKAMNVLRGVIEAVAHVPADFNV